MPNCTSAIQPLDQGIARRFKISINIYKLIFKCMLSCAEEEREYTPIKNKASTKRQKDQYYQLLKKSGYF